MTEYAIDPGLVGAEHEGARVEVTDLSGAAITGVLRGWYVTASEIVATIEPANSSVVEVAASTTAPIHSSVPAADSGLSATTARGLCALHIGHQVALAGREPVEVRQVDIERGQIVVTAPQTPGCSEQQQIVLGPADTIALC